MGAAVAALGRGVVVARKVGVAVTLAASVALAEGVAEGKVMVGSTKLGAAAENGYQVANATSPINITIPATWDD